MRILRYWTGGGDRGKDQKYSEYAQASGGLKSVFCFHFPFNAKTYYF